MIYESADILQIAKRNHNTKRQYLLVNPLQAKHVPVDPNVCLEMMNALGEKLAHEYIFKRCMVISFAETATAVGAVIASSLDTDTYYLPTTREKIGSKHSCTEFKEEHSHAVDQILVTDNFEYLLKHFSTIILVDDELSTGKTIRNIVSALREKYPILNEKTIVAASLINRMSNENLALFEELNIECRWLVKVDNESYESYVNSLNVTEPVNAKHDRVIHVATKIIDSQIYKYEVDGKTLEVICPSLFHIRTGGSGRCGVDECNFVYYNKECYDASKRIISSFTNISPEDKILVLGTEEHMYPAIIFAKLLAKDTKATIKTHATTRSPISICKKENYPIRNGYKIHSFYDFERDNYIYNVDTYDKVFILTDSIADETTIKIALSNLVGVLKSYRCKEIYLIKQ